MKQTTTKSALLTSAMALLLCFAMLLGTTFAWFTDTASTGVNKIQAGTLQISATYQTVDTNGSETIALPSGFPRATSVTFGTAQNLEGAQVIDEQIWEPGAVGVKLIKVHNDGNLNAKIKLQFATQDGGLMDALWYDFMMVQNGTVTGTFTKRPMSTLASFSGAVELPLAPNGAEGDTLSFILAYGMNEEAGNTFQNKSFSAVVTVLATQQTGEYDSIGPDYDATAEYPVSISAIVEVDNGAVATPVTVETTQKVSAAVGAPAVAKVTIPAGVKLANNATQLTFTAEETSIPAGITVGEGEASKTIEVKLDGVAAGNTTPVTVELYVGENLTNVTLYHETSVIPVENYNMETGIITFKTTGFSPFTVTYTKAPAVKYASLQEASGVNFSSDATQPETISIDGNGNTIITDWTDAWVQSNATIKGYTFQNGAVFNAAVDNITITLEDCTFYACDQSKITAAHKVNSGAGMCLNVEKAAHSGVNFVIKNCKFVGENDPTLDREGPRYTATGTIDAQKARGHAIALDAICGGGTGTLGILTIEGCVINGVRGNAIQLYGKTGNITIKDTFINSWGMNNNATKDDAAIRGDFDTNGTRTLTLNNIYFGLTENEDSSVGKPLYHVNVGNYPGNTTGDGNRAAGTYSYSTT